MATSTNIIEPLILSDEENDPNHIANWIERLEVGIELYLFDINDKLPEDNAVKAVKQEELRKNILIASLGKQAHKLLKSYCQPKKLTDFKYDELTNVLVDKLAPTSINYVNEQFKFNLIKQETMESLSVFMARIKDQATHCKFGAEYDNMVRNRFITGLRDSKIRSTLIDQSMTIKDGAITAEEILMKAIAKETANSSSVLMSGSSSAVVNKVASSKNSKNSRGMQKNPLSSNVNKRQDSSVIVCEKCTLRGHSKTECRTRCKYCKQQGHIVKFCKKAKKKSTHKHQDSRHVDTFTSESDDSDTEHDFGYTAESETAVYKVTRTQRGGKFYDKTCIDSDNFTRSSKNIIKQPVLPNVNRQANVSNKCTDNKVDNLVNVCQQSAKLLDSKADLCETSLLNDINSIITNKSKPFFEVSFEW